MVDNMLAALGKYSASMQQASLGGSEFVERATNILNNESAFKMLSRSAACPCVVSPHALTGLDTVQEMALQSAYADVLGLYMEMMGS